MEASGEWNSSYVSKHFTAGMVGLWAETLQILCFYSQNEQFMHGCDSNKKHNQKVKCYTVHSFIFPDFPEAFGSTIGTRFNQQTTSERRPPRRMKTGRRQVGFASEKHS